MPCLVVLVALFFPRVIIALLFLFTDYLHRAYDSVVLPVLGFVFLPFTTLAYAWAKNTYGGVQDIGLVVVIIAVLVDLGSLGGSSRVRRTRY